ncbi:putative alpha-1,2-mannosidase [Streptoalloteichus tenebrarius]|uniref:Alpha-1,2-mannosidase n=1 Tax=Streptoalloteichus tenebrarius (strain ATCC 17920 / DSM 40477 / JCM 4838 / CBS 697.72 / NBRC 16177 / NCIMB 11028 / NRRL B-12390 / A12253. 1 / ISP 5477) TaxID=1933 RepID=A0ABT1HZV7_STRSD|nr:GH92 family glycosyl hydrolase [Streptoalloteichus tenebrarius]MCP2261016.1 putative alpha-1,2-mannosidase [Streptoalloteichus tenebrarius]BFF03192.1 GH92 family glycosyl hydrolase [Streptoalloteichus tenebrarius]
MTGSRPHPRPRAHRPRSTRHRITGALGAALAAVVVAALAPSPPALAQRGQDASAAPEDLARWVNPFVGTEPGGPDHGTGGGAGNTFPGPTVPFGLLQWSPDTVTHQHGGYYYPDNRIRGFSLTHLSGPGCSTYQDVPIMPFVGEVTTSPATDPGRYVSTFSHAREKATAGYYSVALDNGANVELTSTQRTGVGRFTYPEGRPATLLVNVSGSIAGADDAEVTVGRDSMSGWVTSGRFCGVNHRYRLYFHVTFDQPFASVGTWKNGAVTPGATTERGGAEPKIDLERSQPPKNARAAQARAEEAQPGAGTSGRQETTVSGPGTGAYVTFDTARERTVTARVAISFVSIDGARRNLRAENDNRSFEDVHAAARGAWNERLNQVRVRGGTDAQRTTFYTALYHSLLQPNVFSDVDGQYAGFDGRIHRAEKGHAAYSNFSGWDVYRSEIQLLALLAPRETSDMIRSLAAFADQGGAWDRWTVANDYTGVMVGDPYHVMVTSAYAFGAKDFDARAALRSMVRGATVPTQGYRERPGLEDYQKLGYVPLGAEGVWGPPATTLEYTTADFAIAELARRLGDSATWRVFSERSQYWQNLYNPATGHLQARNRDGSFAEPFDPGSPSNWVEGNAAQYTWMVPHNVRGLITALGGDAEVVKRLDTLFTKLNAGPREPYAFLGNEPIMHTPWIYAYAGAPYKAQAVTRRAVNELFGPGPNGLMGNDDLGQMSSWYVWAAMGMYPAIPGRAELVLNSPLFEEVVVTRPGGQRIVVRARGAAADRPYVSGLSIDGAPTTRTWLPESFVERGGVVDFVLSNSADPRWGSEPADAPPSFREGEVGQRGYVEPGRVVVPAGGAGKATVGAQDFSGRGTKVRWTATAPQGITLNPASGEITVPAGGRATQEVGVSVAANTGEGTQRIPVSFTAADGRALPATSLQVMVAEPGSLRSAYNNVGASPDDRQASANYDGFGYSYSRNALEAAGIRPGGTVTVDGVSHRWPTVAVGEPDNVLSNGETVLVQPAPGATRLSLLGSATDGKASGTLTITYTDGTTQNVDIGFSDWALGGTGEPVAFDNRVAAKMPYRNTTGGNSQRLEVYVFATAPIALQQGKQVRSVTLPKSVRGGSLHVFSVATA